MRSREDLVAKVREALCRPNAHLLFEIGLGESNPTQAARAACAQGLSNEEEKLAKWIAIFKRDYGVGWFEALRSVLQLCCSTELREILENSETEHSEMGLTKTQKGTLERIRPENIQEALDILTSRALKLAFDPQAVKREHLGKLPLYESWFLGNSSQMGNEPSLLSAIGMTFEEALNHIPNPEQGHENYLLVVNCLPLAKLMKFVVVNGTRGESRLDENKLEDVVEVPKTLFYWRYGVENGSTMRGKSRVDAEKSFMEKKRQPLTAREVVCLAMTDSSVLEVHRIWASGSRRGVDGVAFLWLSEGEPKLSWDWAYDSFAEWASASCLR